MPSWVKTRRAMPSERGWVTGPFLLAYLPLSWIIAAMICDSCFEEVSVYTRRHGKTTCRLCRSGKVRSCADGFQSLTLTHVRDSHDRPITVTSLRQMRQIEREHHCLSAVVNLDSKHVDEPPQMRKTDAFQEMSRSGGWLYPEIAEPMLAEMRESGELF